MSYAVVGHCPKCGSPVYAESPWWGVTPPPSTPSCNCNPQSNRSYTSASSSGEIAKGGIRYETNPRGEVSTFLPMQ